MNPKYAIPAAIAFAAHALIFFVGSGKPPPQPLPDIPPVAQDTSKKPEKDIIERVVQLAGEEVKNIVNNREAGGGEKIEEILFPPSIPELPPTDYGIDDGRARQKYAPVPIGPGDKIPTSMAGPGGDGDGPGIRVFSPTLLDEPPSTRRQKAPLYPPSLRNSGTTGTVWVSFLVDENGRVQNVKVIKSTNQGFDEATVAAVSEWRFVPGTHKGLPIRFRMSVPVVFSLSD